ncbi:hypothetical protein V6N11_077122 [Hibiscus sabdariffa]|uniref:Uncharacterized protein n=1 Tax=Hibiscus sabdariffa TaxID=183260 RepID=A0ABR2TC47_9ROSI
MDPRLCICFGLNISLYVNDLLGCICGSGCVEGYRIFTWQYFVSSGVVTEQCDPYIDHIGCSHFDCKPIYSTLNCVQNYVKGNFSWKKSKHYDVDAYKVESIPTDLESFPKLESNLASMDVEKYKFEKFLFESNDKLHMIIEPIDHIVIPADFAFLKPVEKLDLLAEYIDGC